tara:strand:- start:1351 stop:2733 length:1383 start_codon:yes stop_codon:yes gene_type:complete
MDDKVINIERPPASPTNENEVSNGARDDQLRLLSQSIRLEETGIPRIARYTTGLIVFSMAAFIGWAAVANINELARAPGEVIPLKYEQVLQHLEGGIVDQILVREGEIVGIGQEIVRLHAADTDTNLERARQRKQSLSFQIERYKAYLDNRELDFSEFSSSDLTEMFEQTRIFNAMLESRGKEREVMEKQLAQQKQLRESLINQVASTRKNLELLEDLHNRRSKLHKSGYVSGVKVMETELRVNSLQGEEAVALRKIAQVDEAIAEFENRIQSLSATRRDEAFSRLEVLQNELNQNDELLKQLQERSERLVVRSPVKGIIKSVNVNTLGGVLQAGQEVASIIPFDDDLVAEVRIPPQYIGRIKPGQKVLVNVSAFDFARFGTIDGTLNHISAMTFKDDRGARYYKGRISLNRNHFGLEPTDNNILPGMTVTANVITGEKTLLEYLLKPIHLAIESALSEY